MNTENLAGTHVAQEELKEFSKLVEVVRTLREKCPWDRAQTIHSMRQYVIEEVFELANSILKEDYNGVREELGDMLLHVVFLSVIAEEKGYFDLQGVIKNLVTKLIARHPHVFGDVKGLSDPDAVKDFWEKEKARKEIKGIYVADGTPPMQKALRVQEKARVLGLDWKDAPDVLPKIKEEITEIEQAMEKGDGESLAEEVGYLMFAIVAFCRHLKIDPEKALHAATEKFLKRANAFKDYCDRMGLEPSNMPPEQVEEVWRAVSEEGK